MRRFCTKSLLNFLTVNSKIIFGAVAIHLAWSTSLFAQSNIIRVEDNIANPPYPTHRIIIFPEEGGSGISSLQLRCENNRTEAYLSTRGVYGHDGLTRMLWQGMDAAERVSADPATTLDAAFLAKPIEFISRLVGEGSVIAEIEGYNVRGAAQFVLIGESHAEFVTLLRHASGPTAYLLRASHKERQGLCRSPRPL